MKAFKGISGAVLGSGAAKAASAAISVALVASASIVGVRTLGGPDARPQAEPAVAETVFPTVSPSAARSPAASPSPSIGRGGPGEGVVWYDGEQWGYPFPGDKPGCVDGAIDQPPCHHVHLLMSGINGNRFIAIDLWRTPDEPRVGDTVTYYAKVSDDDPYCCRIELTIDAAIKPTIIRCTTPEPTPGLVRTGGKATAHITWKATKAGEYYLNLHARGNCGRRYGSETTGSQGMTVYPKPSPTPSPSPSPTPSPSPSAAESPEPSPSPS